MPETIAWTPDDLVSIWEEKDFQSMPFERREALVEDMIADSAQWAREQPDFGPEVYRELGVFIDTQRARLSKTMGEKAAGVAGVIGRTLKSTAAVAGATAADLGLFEPTGEAKMPLANTARSLAFGAKRLGSSIFEGVAGAIGADDALEGELETFKADLLTGNFPVEGGDKAKAWLAERGAKIDTAAFNYHRELTPSSDADDPEVVAHVARRSLVNNPENLARLRTFVETRNPEIWEALRKEMLVTPRREDLNAEAQELKESKFADFLADVGGEDAREVAVEMGDPLDNVVVGAIPIGRGVKAVDAAIRGGAKWTGAGKQIAKGAATETISEVGSQFSEDPNATWGERVERAQDAFIGSLGLIGAGAAGKGVALALQRPRPDVAPPDETAVPEPPPVQLQAPPEPVVAPTVEPESSVTYTPPESAPIQEPATERAEAAAIAASPDPGTAATVKKVFGMASLLPKKPEHEPAIEPATSEPGPTPALTEEESPRLVDQIGAEPDGGAEGAAQGADVAAGLRQALQVTPSAPTIEPAPPSGPAAELSPPDATTEPVTQPAQEVAVERPQEEATKPGVTESEPPATAGQPTRPIAIESKRRINGLADKKNLTVADLRDSTQGVFDAVQRDPLAALAYVREQAAKDWEDKNFKSNFKKIGDFIEKEWPVSGQPTEPAAPAIQAPPEAIEAPATSTETAQTPPAEVVAGPVSEQVAASPKYEQSLASISEQSTQKWGAYGVDVVGPLKKQVRELERETNEIYYKSRAAVPDASGKRKQSIKSVLKELGVSTREEANELFKSKQKALAETKEKLAAAQTEFDKLAQQKDRDAKNWSSAVSRRKEPAASGEERLATIVNQTVDLSNKAGKLGFSPFGSTRPADVVLGATDLKSNSRAVEARWQAAVAKKPSILSRLQEGAVNAWHSFTRDYAELHSRTFAREIDILRRLKASKNASARQTADVLRGITMRLGPKQYSVFNRVVALEDLMKDAESGMYNGRPLPFGYRDQAELEADFTKFSSIAAATPQISQALTLRKDFMDSLRQTLVDRGFLPAEVLNDPRYFHHQVLFYMAARNSTGGAKSFRDWFSGWQRKRSGSSLDYNRQYVESEAEVIADAFNKFIMQDLQGEMRATSDLTPELKNLFGADWRKNIPKTHTAWQPKRGNVFYPAQTVSEKAIDEYFNGIRELLPEDFKEALAMGGRRQEWIVPKELAEVLDNLAPRKDTWPERILAAGSGGWKRYILLMPLRALKYTLGNTSGDVDFVFAAQPKIFAEFKKAAPDMHGFHVKGKAATGDIKEAMQLGVIGSGWRASELPDIGRTQYFEWLTGEKPGIVDRYWNFIGKWNDAREDVARLAAYRFALKEWNAGRPYFGASVPADVNLIADNKHRAAKVARELLIDYGRETEFGEIMRSKVMPFYRWMHGNFARYIQLVKNVRDAEGAGAAARVGGKLAAQAALRKSATLAVRASFGYVAINLWNQLFFPDEEEELGESANQLHLILGRDEQGNVQTIRFQGALSDLLGWVGMENLPQDIEDVFKGAASVGDKMEDAYEAAISRAVNATSPFYKTAAEAVFRQTTFPNALQPRPVRDPKEHIAGLFSLKSVYQWLAGKPHKPFAREVAGLLTYTTDPGEAAYNATRHMAAEWLEDRGEDRGSIIPSKRSNALYYHKQALKYKDAKLAAKFLDQYMALGGKAEGLKQSIKTSEPLAMLSKKHREEFFKSLTDGERATVEKASSWFTKIYGGQKKFQLSPDALMPRR